MPRVRISCIKVISQLQPLQLKVVIHVLCAVFFIGFSSLHQQGHSSLFQRLGAANQMRPSSIDIGMKVKYQPSVSS
ncbi:hypothetical protein POTOM_061034 [Populus tomentosa]|uniref:Uncharacterized protein n=1 Tax=Populus tomentosa TaxID=118781 RepID=A0A8X7XMF8_POPTO|nr:hypothetical protein POTOM_061034 [Populus tomentosa]